MLYYLFDLLKDYDFPGHNLMSFISFRAIMANMTALLVSLLFGRKFIGWLIRHRIYDGGREPDAIQNGERNFGFVDEKIKKKTPTMGGVFIIFSILVSVLLLCDLTNIYTILLIVTLLWMGGIGFIDDYIKVIKNNKNGLSKKQKIIGQFTLALGVALAICFSSDIDTYKLITTLPFIKSNEFDYSWLSPFSGQPGVYFTWAVYLLMIILVIIACSNSTNLTDGMDGLAAGTSSIVGAVLMAFAWLGGNIIYAEYLSISYLPGTGEIVVFMAALVGALVGFLWYNAKPAEVFMGDVGSLAIGGVFGVSAVLLHKELLLPLLCGVFFMESLSTIIQQAYFKITRKRYGQGRRIWSMTPLHHHYQEKKGGSLDGQVVFPKPNPPHDEAKISVRFWIVQLILAVLTLALLKIR